MALISFHKKTRVEWARPLNCKLEGDCAVGEGVAQLFFSTCIDKLKSGFSVNLALVSPDFLREKQIIWCRHPHPFWSTVICLLWLGEFWDTLLYMEGSVCLL